MTHDCILAISTHTDSADLFKDYTPSVDFLKSLNASFAFYADQFDGDKSVNALNCRKSAILSNLFLRHKLLASSKLTLTSAQLNDLFLPLIVKYV